METDANANANAGPLTDWAYDPDDPAGAMVARYEYDLYRNVAAQSGQLGGGVIVVMADDRPGGQKHYVFRDVRGVIGNAFEVLRHG